MKKIIVLLVVVFMFIGCGSDKKTEKVQEKEVKKVNKLDNMASFLGIKWGTSETEFKKTFKQIDKCNEIAGIYFLENFKLFGVIVPQGDLGFNTKKGGDPKEIYFYRASFKIKPDQFDLFYATLIEKYGKPQLDKSKIITGSEKNYEQRSVMWQNEALGRAVALINRTEKINEGSFILSPIPSE